MTWNDERKANLLKFHAMGLSGSQIADRIPGVSRNAVIGKLHRLGLTSRGKAGPQPRKAVVTAVPPKARRSAAPPHVKARPPIIPLPIPEPAPTDAARVKLLDLEPHHCRFPVGDPQHADFGFCGHSKVEGISYCQHHAQRAYGVTYVNPARTGDTKVIAGAETAAAAAEEILEPA